MVKIACLKLLILNFHFHVSFGQDFLEHPVNAYIYAISAPSRPFTQVDPYVSLRKREGVAPSPPAPPPPTIQLPRFCIIWMLRESACVSWVV